uniref:Uncharacterized protein n=1 Tax=Aegilops tauschii subsp. strangulata TaxID=200361 RepID=A0A453LJF6_AEGTS
MWRVYATVVGTGKILKRLAFQISPRESVVSRSLHSDDKFYRPHTTIYQNL